MANDKALTDDNIRDLITEWLFQELWHNKTRPSDDIHAEYIRALMNLAGADGVLADEERNGSWVVKRPKASG